MQYQSISQKFDEIRKLTDETVAGLSKEIPGLSRPRSLNDMDESRNYCFCCLDSDHLKGLKVGWVFDMSGTASTEEDQIRNVYKVQQTIRGLLRTDHADMQDIAYAGSMSWVRREDVQKALNKGSWEVLW